MAERPYGGTHRQGPILEQLRQRGLTRREFLRLCAFGAALLRLPGLVGGSGTQSRALRRVVAHALETKPPVPAIWLSFQDCAGCSEAFTRSRQPRFLDLLLESISLEYHELLSAATGSAAEEHRAQVMQSFAGAYVLVVEGSLPLASSGACCTIGGLAAADLLAEAAEQAAATLAVGSCAAFGGIPAAEPNPTEATAVWEVIDRGKLLNVPGCPPIPEVLAGSLLHWVVFDGWPERDEWLRPVNAYGQTVHSACPRRPFFRRGQFAEAFDDEAARQGWCLLHLGCRGPETANACSVLRWGNGISFPVQSGHPCFGCSEPGFWDGQSIYPRARRSFFDVCLPWLARQG